MNGYRVTYEYRVREVNDYSYESEEYTFQNWNDVVQFIETHKLTSPPAKI